MYRGRVGWLSSCLRTGPPPAYGTDTDDGCERTVVLGDTMHLLLAGFQSARRVAVGTFMAWHDKQGNAQNAWNCLKTYHGAERC